MTKWPQFPVVYEINTWIWLQDLGQAAGAPVTLDQVPDSELDRLAGLGFDGVWLMGVWQRSPQGRQVALEHQELQAEYRRALPDFRPEDVVGSPYSVYGYAVDRRLGGDQALAGLRQRLDARGLKLILDFVPNHMAVDHPWLADYPQRLVRGGPDSLIREPGNYFQTVAEGQWRVFAYGRDPYFAGWTDTVQIDYRRPETRRAMEDLLLSVAGRCDGIRCDMAMLVTQDIFQRTWGGQFDPPHAEFWPCAVTGVKAAYPDFLLLAEVYWDLEWELQQQGFDYTYDKRLYDRLLEGDPLQVQMHLKAAMDYQRHLARFIENHDERRAAEAFGVAHSRVAAVLALTLPGFRLLHQGQLEGRQVKLPVQLGRRLPEVPLADLQSFYGRLLEALRHPVFHDGDWLLLRPQPEWQGNQSYRQVVAHRWTLEGAHRVVAANLSGEPAQFFLPVEIPALAGQSWQLRDLLNDETYVRGGDEMLGRGLYVDLPGYGYHLLEFQPA